MKTITVTSCSTVTGCSVSVSDTTTTTTSSELPGVTVFGEDGDETTNYDITEDGDGGACFFEWNDPGYDNVGWDGNDPGGKRF